MHASIVIMILLTCTDGINIKTEILIKNKDNLTNFT